MRGPGWGAAPLRLLFEKAAGPLAGPGSPGAFWRGLRLVSLDGTTLDVQDTAPNWAHFGGPSTKEPWVRSYAGAFPQVRLLALAECGTRALIAACCGAYGTREKTLARQLLPRLAAGMCSWRMRTSPATSCGGTQQPASRSCCGRPSAPAQPARGCGAGRTGTYLSRLKAPARHLRKQGAADITVRVIEYHLAGATGGVAETFTLITTLTGPDAAPARELAELYHGRSGDRDRARCLQDRDEGRRDRAALQDPGRRRGGRSGLLLCAYHAIRELICAAAALARADPLRISFANALDTIRAPVGDPGAFPP